MEEKSQKDIFGRCSRLTRSLEDIDDALQELERAGVKGIIGVGVNKESNKRDP